MHCPACGGTLTQMIAGDFELDACVNGCGGVWFDRDELVKFDEPHEFDGHAILSLAEKKRGVKVDSSKQKKCPHCTDEPLVRQFMDVKNQIEIDQCWECAGIWFDVGEINQVRNQYKTYEERAKAVNTYIDQGLTDTKAALNKATKEQVERYNADTSNRLRSALFAFKKLLGIENDLNDGL